MFWKFQFQSSPKSLKHRPDSLYSDRNAPGANSLFNEFNSALRLRGCRRRYIHLLIMRFQIFPFNSINFQISWKKFRMFSKRISSILILILSRLTIKMKIYNKITRIENKVGSREPYFTYNFSSLFLSLWQISKLGSLELSGLNAE